jgi:F-type H+-transporting ATPase subunit epsilon
MVRSNIVPRLALVATATYFAQQAFVGGRPAAQSSNVILRAEGESSGSDRVQLKVLSPEGSGIQETVSEVVLPSASGQLGVLSNHAPMMSALDIGVLRYKQKGQWKPLVTYGGFAQVEKNVLSILVNDFETVDGIDTNEAKKALEAATAKLEKAESKKDKLDATTAVKKASARLQAAMFGKK